MRLRFGGVVLGDAADVRHCEFVTLANPSRLTPSRNRRLASEAETLADSSHSYFPFDESDTIETQPKPEDLTMNSIAITLLVSLCLPAVISADDTDETKKEIESLLARQDACWNSEDIEGFMQTYWKSDKLTFSGGGKTTRGWQATLDRYKASYPRGQMGNLNFDQLEVNLLSASVALVLGRWHLDIQGENKDGNFSLVMKKFDGGWKIVHDHSSTLETEKGWLSIAQAEQVAKNHFHNSDALESHPQGHYLQVVAGPDQASMIYVNRKTAAISTDPPNDLESAPK